MLELHKKDIPLVSLYVDSLGGNVDEALKIAAHVRKLTVTTGNWSGTCYSACAIIWLAGVRRYSTKSLGLHRSYFSQNRNMSFTEMEQSLDASHNSVVNFLQEIRVPNYVIDIFLQTPSDEITIIDDTPLRTDRLFEEYLIMQCGVEPRPTQGWTCDGFYESREPKDAEMSRELCVKLKLFFLSPVMDNWDQCRYKAAVKAAIEAQLQ